MPRFSNSIFNDPHLHEELSTKGYAVRACLSRDQVEELSAGFDQILKALPEGLPNMFWPSGRSSDPAIRNRARNIIESIVPDALKPFFANNAAYFEGGTFLIKPCGEGTALSPHQDSSHVDEEESYSVYAWIPLTDTTVENGALHVLPGSHLFGNRHRSLNVPWAFKGLENELAQYMIPVEMRAGEVCFFEGATIHHSPTNRSPQTRVALNYFIRPSSQQFLHHFRDEKTPDGMVEVYGVSIDFFYNEDFESRPPQEYFLRYEPWSNLELNAETLEVLVNRYRPI